MMIYELNTLICMHILILSVSAASSVIARLQFIPTENETFEHAVETLNGLLSASLHL